jgi:ribulose-phosphate 3-epimerase
MVREPERRMEEWALAGATTLIIHVESTEHLEDIFAYCGERRVEVALALKPSTDIEVLAPYVDRALFVQCMGSDRIGYHGVSLDPRTLDTIRALRARYPSTAVGVDIGVSARTLPNLVAAGATRFAAGSAVFGRGTAKESYRELDALLSSLMAH